MNESTGETNSFLENPVALVSFLHDASAALSSAHHYGGEREGDRGDLNGPARDLIYGLNTAVESLAQMIEEGRFDRDGATP